MYFLDRRDRLFLRTSTEPISRQARSETTAASSQPSHPPAKRHSTREKPPLVDDDGKTLWVSPTHGSPLDLAYLSPGAQIIAVLRPAALLQHPEGEKVRAALGPTGQAEIKFVEQMTGMRLTDMEQLIVGCQASSDGKWMVTFVVHTPQISFPAMLLATATRRDRKKT